MVTLVVRLSDLEFLSPHDLSGGLSTAEIIDVIRKQFDYLPGELQVDLNDGVATIQFEEASTNDQTEARRLFEKAGKRAKNGEFRKAKGIYERVIELDPAMTVARRDLAMALFELDELECAKNELIDALRLQPDDAWSYVILGNIYLKHDRDLQTAARFFTRALELKPGDPYALHGLAAASSELGDQAKALRCFDEAITAHPEFANAWLGKAILFHREDKPTKVVEVLETMFGRAEIMDARSQPVFTEGRKLYLSSRRELAEAQRSEAFKALETYKADVAEASGYPVKVQTEAVPGQLSGVAQMAWKHGRDHHIVQVSDRLTPPDG
ncbi:MAG: tetratricopeptide repeat protein [Chthoniobacteraceae bacterium]